jgi:malonyl-CoA O-methyltransferase
MLPESVLLPVEDAYDRWSAFYDSYDNPMVFMAGQIVERSLAGVERKAIFEFGCGTGRNLAALARRGAAPLAGCDLSAGMLSVARRRGGGWNLFQHDIALPVPAPSDSVDLALFCLTLEHLADLRPPLEEARRIVKPGGRISIIEIHPFLSLNGLAAHFEDGDVEVRMPAFPHQFEDYLNLFAELGLGLTACREWSPEDVGNPAELRSTKRAASAPLAVEFSIGG